MEKDQLAEDLQRHRNELASSKDVLGGLAILMTIGAEIAGLLTVVVASIKVTAMILGPLAALGLPVALPPIQAAIAKQHTRVIQKYCSLDSKKRKSLRAALNFLGLGIKFS